MPEPGSASTRQGTALAFDFGEKRIGVAVGEHLLSQSHPLCIIREVEKNARFAAIARIIEEWHPTTLVVGLPCHADGTPHEMTARCTRFANQLKGRFGLPVSLVDERLTSLDAESRLRESGHNARSAKNHLDAVAAQLILQSYFDTAHD